MHGPLKVKVDWLFFTDVSGQIIGPIFKGSSSLNAEDGLSRNFDNKLPIYAA